MINQQTPRHYLSTFAFALALLLMLIGVALTPQSLRHISPIIFICTLYAWSIFSSHPLPMVAIFCLGLINDVLMGAPMGATPLAALLLHWLVQRDLKLLKRNFTSIWMHFAIHLCLTMLFFAAVLSLYQWQWIAWQPLLLQTLFTFICYPPLQLLLVWLLTQLKMVEHG
jgi:rod shape-determining protein MreD